MPRLCLSLSSTHGTSCAWPPVLPKPLRRASHACLRVPPSQAYHGNCTLRISNDRCPSSNGRETRCVRCELRPSSSGGGWGNRGGGGSGGGGGGSVEASATARESTSEAVAPNTPRPRGGVPHSAPTIADIEAAAAARGVRLEVETTGPFFTISAYDATGAFDDHREDKREGQGGARTSAGTDARGGKPRLLGRAQGCIRPLLWGSNGSNSTSGSSSSGSAGLFPPPLLHLDSVRMARIDDARQRGVFGAALLIGALVFRWAVDTHGCRVAQLLAIDDTDEYHAKLVKYYSRLGMRAVRVVEGGSLGDVPHMLVWGGAGTLMEGEILPLLTRWARVFPPTAPAAAAAPAGTASAATGAATGSGVASD